MSSYGHSSVTVCSVNCTMIVFVPIHPVYTLQTARVSMGYLYDVNVPDFIYKTGLSGMCIVLRLGNRVLEGIVTSRSEISVQRL
jgi:hypothetical protein